MKKRKRVVLRKRWWTAVVRYPEYMVDDYPDEIYSGWVRAVFQDDAIAAVQRMAVRANRTSAYADQLKPEDFEPVVALWGRHTIINPN